MYNVLPARTPGLNGSPVLGAFSGRMMRCAVRDACANASREAIAATTPRTTPATSAIAMRARCPVMVSSARLAREVRSLVGAAASLIDGNLRVRTERTRAVRFSVAHLRRDDRVGRLALLHPLLERADHVERVRSLAAAAVAHA